MNTVTQNNLKTNTEKKKKKKKKKTNNNNNKENKLYTLYILHVPGNHISHLVFLKVWSPCYYLDGDQKTLA